MKKLKLIFILLLTQIALAGDSYTIRISPEVIEAMDLSPELAARLSGGDIIGNGGGLVEQEFRFSYLRLPRLIDTCLRTFSCPFGDDEMEVLRKISNVAKKYAQEKDRLIFLAESEYPGFFRDSEDSQIRIAKTAFIPGAPIFINLDMVYFENQPRIEYSSMISLLIHEIGHQIGIKSHSLLDDIGARFKEYLTRDTYVSKMEVDGSLAHVRIFNLEKNQQFAEVFFSYKGVISPLTSKIRDLVVCQRKGSVLLGYELSNPHWLRMNSIRGVRKVKYRAWLKASCMDVATSAIWNEDKDLKIDFTFYDGRFLNSVIEVED